MPQPISSALLSLAAAEPCSVTLARSRTNSVKPWRLAQFVIWRKAMAVPPG